MALTVELANAAILLGYFAMGVLMSTWVLPVKRWIITVTASIVFFATCALTHLHQLGHLVAGEPMTVNDLGSPHMAIIHVPQAAAVWVAVFGLLAAQRYITRLHERIQDLEDSLVGKGTP